MSTEILVLIPLAYLLCVAVLAYACHLRRHP